MAVLNYALFGATKQRALQQMGSPVCFCVSATFFARFVISGVSGSVEFFDACPDFFALFVDGGRLGR